MQPFQNSFWTPTTYRGAFEPAPSPMWTDVWTNWDPQNTIYPVHTQTISGEILNSLTWTSNNVYLVQGPVYVKSLLTIQPGTVVLFDKVVQPVRDHFGPTVLNSGYRGPELNEAVGGSSKSQHCKGQAADIEVPGVPNAELAEWIKENCDFDQLILEFYTPGIPDSGWVHVSYVSEEDNRKSILTASRIDGKTQYSVGLNAQEKENVNNRFIR